MYVSDYKKNYIISLDNYTIFKGEEATELEDGHKETDYCIYAELLTGNTLKRICLYRNFEKESTECEFKELLKALQNSADFFQFGETTYWDERK